MSIGLYIMILGFMSMMGMNNKDIMTSMWPKLVKQTSLMLSMMSLYMMLYWWYMYETNMNGYQLMTNMYNMSLGLDSMSLYLMMLTGMMMPMSLLSNWNNMKNNNMSRQSHEGKFNMLMLLLGMMLLINYLAMDLLSFYMFFEASLIPLFMLIGMYGANNKEKAAYYVLMFTFTSSLFMLLSMVVTTYMINTTSCLMYSQFMLSIDLQMLLWIGIMLGILVKTPLFPFHVWLPVVHSESPLGGSIMLAGLMLKLTVYLIIRWLLPFLAEASMMFYPTVYIICMLTIIYTSLTTLAQIDLKVIIAYSSISHMGVCMIGVFANNIIGIEGSYLLSLSHGFMSPGLFIAVGGILYDRYHTRILMYYQGLLSFMPVFALYLLMLSFANIGTPLSGNFIGEFLSLTGAFQRSPIFTTIASFSMLLSATYQMKLTSRLTGGIKSPYIKLTNDLTNRESILMLSTILPCLLLGIYPMFIFKGLYANLSNVIYLF
uniref:NADH-ubiquinone oxidoreductase chain 4 n=2 Tax=Magnusiomyces TaxID=1095182 RepID=A0A8E5J643_9ASCO|nr:NADH dehydrogenase subunit 4 [Magnusiomyces ingens]YP_010180065.1 NADH dehydrogenase subunit 4 [Saprochaete ingens]AHY04901.1 NADH dehydrogenase subunit 4 [Magnusiomyces ingens]QUX32911.1 NADH dehydrogenase subunit 4 [Magnusiomyces ingens]QUX32933.1 NADH dehydrogenase subunit 4 [Saprochaete ingens]